MVIPESINLLVLWLLLIVSLSFSEIECDNSIAEMENWDKEIVSKDLDVKKPASLLKVPTWHSVPVLYIRCSIL